MSSVERIPTVEAKVLDVKRVRADFPIFKQKIHGKPLVYLDTAATAQKPDSVIDIEARFYREDYANVHRGLHTLSERSTQAYEGGRAKVAEFINAPSAEQIVFVRGTTEAINLVAQTYGRANVGEGDEILITGLEHHSNIVPWQMLCEQTGSRLRVAPIDDAGDVRMDEFEALLGPRTKIAAISQQSNALGTINPVKCMIDLAHKHGTKVLIDGAQAVLHGRVDVQKLNCDFYAFSSHKLYGPSGVGALYGKKDLLDSMPPYQGGGEMILSVSFDKTTYNRVPHKFEAGTPNIAGVVGFGAAIDYVTELGIETISSHENTVLSYATDKVSAIDGLRIIGTSKHKAGVLSFVLDKIHPHDIGTILDHEGIAVRAGHHCAQPVMEHFDVPATARASFGLYNSLEDVDRLVSGIRKVIEVMG